MEFPASDLQRIRELYARGRYREALAVGAAHGPVRAWCGAPGRLLAGRLAIQLGAPRLGHQLHLAAFRENPANLEAIYYHARFRMERFGPLSALRFSRQHEDWSDAPPGLRADWLGVQALVYARLQDFDRAERAIVQAEVGAVDRAWIFVERSSVLELCERPAEAMEAARRALEMQPWFRPAVQSVAHLLQREGREDEAVEFLTEAQPHIDGGVIPAQLATLQYDLHRYADARRSLDLFAELSPLMEDEVRKWLGARRADVAYLLGDSHAAAPFAEAVGDEFSTLFAAALRAEPAGADSVAAHRRVLDLDFTFSKTAPSALDLLGRYHKHATPPVPPDAPVEFDGLPDAAERARLDATGWATREFALQPGIAFDLIDRGLPFLVTLVETGYGQARLIVGADRLRQSLFFVEGSERRPGEAPFAVLLDRYKVFGPRCLVAVPAADAAKLDGLTFPDAAECDQLYAVQTALHAHDYARAKAGVEALQAAGPGHRLAKFAALAYARGTAHPVLQLLAADDLLRDFPTDSTLVLSKAAALRDLGRMKERRDVLAAAVEAGATESLVLQSLAQMLLPDHTQQREAELLLRRSVRQRPQGAPGYFLLASQQWEQRDFAAALELYRFACCLDDRETQFAEAYSRAARVLDLGSEAVRLFQLRANRAALPYVPAVESLCNTLGDRGDTDFAFSAIDNAVDKTRAFTLSNTPDAAEVLGELLLFRADLHADHGLGSEADADLVEAKQYVAAPDLLRKSIGIARAKPDPTAALDLVKQLLVLEPVSVEGHRQAAGLLVETEGRAAARQHLARVSRRYPEHYGLARLDAEFLYPDQDAAALEATRRLLALCPVDAWAYRQLALLNADLKRHDDARRAIESARGLEPTHSSQFSVQAHVFRRADRIDDALETFRECLRHHPDHELAVYEMVHLSRGLKEKRQALRHVLTQLRTQPSNGDGLLAYHAAASELVDDPEAMDRLVADLEAFLEERPDLWQAWSAVVQLLANADRTEEAATLARDAVAHFPLSARLWIDLSIVCKMLEQPDDRIDALRKAATIAPGWIPASRELADALNEADQRDEALAALEQLLPHAAAEAHAHWLLAEQFWQADRGREALDRAKQAVRLDAHGDPRLESAWRAVVMWSDRLDSPTEALEFARELTVVRAGDPRAWLRYARSITEISQANEIVAALDKALALDPKNVEAYDLKAERLGMLGRFEDALEAARPSALAADVPLVLQGRAAWVEARRGNYASAIPPMQALVAVDPDYLWGWQQLAEWYNDVGKPESFLEVTSELMRLRPDSPLHLMMRGDAKIQTGDRDGGKADLREALRIHAGYSPAAVVLFDACLQDGEHREARTALAVLQEHLNGPEVIVKQIQYAARTNDVEATTRGFRELATTPGEGPPVYLQMALNEMNTLDVGERAAEILREAWEEGAEFNPWAPVFWMETPDGEQADEEVRLAACDALVTHYPHFLSGHDRRAEILTSLGRSDDALQACRPLAFEPPYPLTLRGRAAWVEAQRGNRALAVEQMKEILAEDAEYSWGWRQLATWYEFLGRERDRLDAADHLVRLNPGDAFAHLIRGEARQSLGDNRGAKDDYHRAFELDPAFQAAGLQLIATQLETDDLSGAAKTLAKLKEHADGPYVRLRVVQVAARQGHLEEARSTFRAMLTDLTVSRGVLEECVTKFREAGWVAEAEEELTQAATSEAVTPQAAGVWVGALLKENETARVADLLAPLAERDRDAGREAVLTYAAGLTDLGSPANAATTVQRFSELLRQDDDSWARAGRVLVDARQFPLAVAWLADWEERPDRAAWMMRVLFDAYQQLGDAAKAEAVALAVLTADDESGEADDDLLADFLAWLALFATLRGESDAADDFLDRVEPVGQPDGVRVVLKLSEALLTVQRAADKAVAFAEVRQDLRVAADSCATKERLPGTAAAYRRVTTRLAADAGGLTAKLWSLAQRVRPWIAADAGT
jgi:tetratricopeptide (TPR) repeat protein